jgi:hypothetical protein
LRDYREVLCRRKTAAASFATPQPTCFKKQFLGGKHHEAFKENLSGTGFGIVMHNVPECLQKGSPGN